MNDNVLILGATGTVGSLVTSATLETGARVRALVRSDASARKLPKGVEPVLGDLRDDAALQRAFQGVDAAFFAAPHESDEEELCARVVRHAKASGARLVFVGVHADGATWLHRAVQRFTYGWFLPHYRPKFRLSEHVRQQLSNAVLLMPTNFFQNDELFRDELMGGVFSQPFGLINRVDVRDLARAAARALTDSGIAAGAYPVSGPVSLSGEDCAKQWSQVLGRAVTVERDVARIDASIARALTGKKRDDFTATYRMLGKFKVPTTQRDLEKTRALLGREPISYAQYVRELAESWRPSLAISA